MRLARARVQKYRSIRDSGWFDVENLKTILVGPNEAGKTAVLQALQQINPPAGVARFEALRDYPRSEYNDISTGKVQPSSVAVVEADFLLDESDRSELPVGFEGVGGYRLTRYLNNQYSHQFLSPTPGRTIYGAVKKDLLRLAAILDGEGDDWTKSLAAITANFKDTTILCSPAVDPLNGWLKKGFPKLDEGSDHEKRYDKVVQAIAQETDWKAALEIVHSRLPVFVLFNNYFRVKPRVHLEHLASRIETNSLDDTQYDYGNKCLLTLLGFTARTLSNVAKVPEPAPGDLNALKKYRDALDNRAYQLNAASYRLTQEIRSVWVPDQKKAEADTLKILADGQYLKVVVADELGVDIELDQRSEGFQWLVSFFIVFFAESADKHKNAVLLLDEPGMSLHALKQREFRQTISRLAEANQTIYTTHSPFLVGPNELDLVRIAEMTDRSVGTKIHTGITSSDPASLLPLQEALGYDLAQSLFGQQRNLVLEGLTDYWYVEALSHLLRESGSADLDERIAFVPAGSAGKVVYYATLLHAQKLKVAALLDSDVAGDQAAQQDELVNALHNKGILRTKDVYSGPVKRPEIEDLLRETLVKVAQSDLSWDISKTALAQPGRPIVDIFEAEVSGFSKFKLAKAFLRWARAHSSTDLTSQERSDGAKLISVVNKALK